MFWKSTMVTHLMITCKRNHCLNHAIFQLGTFVSISIKLEKNLKIQWRGKHLLILSYS